MTPGRGWELVQAYLSSSRAVAASMTSVLKTLSCGLVSSGRRASARQEGEKGLQDYGRRDEVGKS